MSKSVKQGKQKTVSRDKKGGKSTTSKESTEDNGLNAADTIASYEARAATREQAHLTLLRDISVPPATHYLANMAKINRPPILISDKVVQADTEYNYMFETFKIEGWEYFIIPAPTRNNIRLYWKMIIKETVHVAVCLCHDDQMSDSDENKCYPYFPTEVDKTIEVALDKGKYVINCKAKDVLSFGVTKYDLMLTTVDTGEPVENNADNPTYVASEEGKHSLILYHSTSWNGKYAKDAFDEAANVAMFCKEILKTEMNVLRSNLGNAGNSMPLVIQSFDGAGRAAVLWTGVAMAKVVERKEHFDVPDTMRQLVKLRNGCFPTYFHYAFTYAVALRIGADSKWMTESECNTKMAELVKGFEKRKLSDTGVPI